MVNNLRYQAGILELEVIHYRDSKVGWKFLMERLDNVNSWAQLIDSTIKLELERDKNTKLKG